jgi:hypothetical protein
MPHLSFGDVAACVSLQKANPAPPDDRWVTLRTIADASNYMLALPEDSVHLCRRWRRAAELIIEQADVAAVSRQVHLALFYDAQLDMETGLSLFEKLAQGAYIGPHHRQGLDAWRRWPRPGGAPTLT